MDPSELRDRAVSAFAKGKFAKAAESYEAYCEQVPSDFQAWIRLGDSWSRLRKKDKAVAAYFQAAKSYAGSGFFPRAIAACKLVLEIEPEHTGVKAMLEELYVQKMVPRTSTLSGVATHSAPSAPGVPSAPSVPGVHAPGVHVPGVHGAAEAAERARPTPAPEEARPRAPEEEGQGAGAPLAGVPTLLGELSPLPKPLEAPSEPSQWAKPPSIRPAVVLGIAEGPESRVEGAPGNREAKRGGGGAFHAIEDAAKASLEELGENPNAWLLEAKHAPSRGLPVDIPLFSDLPQAALVALFNHCPLRRFSPGTFVIAQGERGNSFFVICSGEVRVFRMQGREQVELALLKEGEFFGEMALLSGEPRSAFVEAVEPDTQVLEIPADALAGLSRKFPQISSALWRFYRQRLLSNVMSGSLLFRPFGVGDRQELIRCFQAVDVSTSTVVVKQNEMSEGLFVVLVGRLEVLKEAERIAELREGDLFGEISLLTKAPATASVVAVERSSLLKLPAKEFNTLISTHPQVLELLSRLMEERMKSDKGFSLESLRWEDDEFDVLI